MNVATHNTDNDAQTRHEFQRAKALQLATGCSWSEALQRARSKQPKRPWPFMVRKEK